MKEVTVTITIDGVNHKIEGIPAVAWEAFKREAKVHFPKSGEDAWAAAISEMIVSMIGGESRTYFLTEIPLPFAEAYERKLDQVKWKPDQFLSYLLRSAYKDQMKIVSFTNKDQLFGTLVITGIDPVAFEKIEEIAKHKTEDIFATVFLAAAKGEVSITANTYAKPS